MKCAHVMMMWAVLSAALIGGCAAPLSQMEKARESYESTKGLEDAAKAERDKAQAEARAKSEKAAEKEIERQLAAAKYAEAQKLEAERIRKEAEAKATALEKRAQELKSVAAKEAAALEASAVELDPVTGEPDDDKADAEPTPPARLPSAPTFVDIEVSTWTSAGVKRLTDYPTGWSLSVDEADARLLVLIEGVERRTFRRPPAFKGPECYRLSAGPSGTVEIDRCPAVSGSGSE